MDGHRRCQVVRGAQQRFGRGSSRRCLSETAPLSVLRARLQAAGIAAGRGEAAMELDGGGRT